MNKNGQMKGGVGMFIGIGLVALLVAMVFGWIPNPLAPATTTPAASTASSGAAVTPSSTSVLTTSVAEVTYTLDTWDKYARNTEITDGSHRIIRYNADGSIRSATWQNEGTTFKVGPGEKFDVILGLNSTTYYPVKVQFTAPQASGQEVASAGLVAIDTALSMTAFDNVGQPISSSRTLAVGANDKVSPVDLRIAVASAKGFGDSDHPGSGNVVCANYNDTLYDGIKGSGLTSVGIPRQLNATVDYTYECYNFPTLFYDPNSGITGDVLPKVWRGSFVVDSSSTNPTGANGNFTWYAIDTSVDLHSETLAFLTAIEDDLFTNIGTTGIPSVVVQVS